MLAASCVCACALAGAAVAAAVKPVISGISATPGYLPVGGTTTISASVEGGSECTLSAKGPKSSPVAGLPVTFPCESGSVSSEVAMPRNSARKAAHYKFQLTATGTDDRSAKAKVKVGVGSYYNTAPALSISVSGHTGTICAVLTTAHVVCRGTLTGDGSEEASAIPVGALGITDASEVSRRGATCALLGGGPVDCWGSNRWGQLGLGSTEGPETCAHLGACSLSPLEVPGTLGASDVAVGGGSVSGHPEAEVQACAVLADGHVECWGGGGQGELGDGSFKSSAVPVEVEGLTETVQVSAGGDFSCALLATGHIDCWGGDYDGELGDGTAIREAPYGLDTPVEVQGITDATQVSANGLHACALLSSGHAECWGADKDGQLGNDTDAPQYEASPVEVQGLTGATSIAAGEQSKAFAISDETTCASSSTGQVDCWGIVFNKVKVPEKILTPTAMEGVSDATQVAVGADEECALLSTGHVVCWHGEFRRPTEVPGIGDG